MPEVARIRWAPKVERAKIRRLYEQDAQGIVDRALVDEVAYAFWARCESILIVTEAVRGRIRCPVCGAMIERQGHSKSQVLLCVVCGWRVTWGAYQRTYKEKQLFGGGAVGAIEDFMERLPRARSYVDKMLLIDYLVHECHHSLDHQGNEVYRRPVAVNLIDGTMTEVVHLVQDLASGPGSTMGAPKVRAQWQDRVLASSRNRARWLSPASGE